METALRQLSLSTGEDILLAHELAMHLARRAGAGPTDQINFAARVAQQCTIGGQVIIAFPAREVIFAQSREFAGEIKFVGAKTHLKRSFGP